MNTKFDTNITEAQFNDISRKIGKYVAYHPKDANVILLNAGIVPSSNNKADILDEIFENIKNKKVSEPLFKSISECCGKENNLNFAAEIAGAVGAIAAPMIGLFDKSDERIAKSQLEAQKELAKSMEVQSAYNAQLGAIKSKNAIKIAGIIGISLAVVGVFGAIVYSMKKPSKK